MTHGPSTLPVDAELGASVGRLPEALRRVPDAAASRSPDRRSTVRASWRSCSPEGTHWPSTQLATYRRAASRRARSEGPRTWPECITQSLQLRNRSNGGSSLTAWAQLVVGVDGPMPSVVGLLHGGENELSSVKVTGTPSGPGARYGLDDDAPCADRRRRWPGGYARCPMTSDRSGGTVGNCDLRWRCSPAKLPRERSPRDGVGR